MTLYQYYQIVVYTTTEEEISVLILDHIEKLCELEGKLFTVKLYSKDCEKSIGYEHLKFRNLGLIISNNVENRKAKNVVVVGVGYEEMANNLKNYIPVKPYEGKKRDHALKYLLEYLVYKIEQASDVREAIQ